MNEFRLFWPYARKQAGLYLLGFAGSLFRFLIPLSVPLVIRYLFDGLLRDDAISRADKIGQLTLIAAAMLIVFFAVRAPMEYVRQYFMNKANNNVVKALRRDTFRKVHALDAKYFADNRSGEIGTRFFDDIEKIRGYMTALFSNVWIETIVLLFVVGVMLTFNVWLTALAAALVGLQFTLAHFMSRRLKRATRSMMGRRSALSGFVFEQIQGALLTKLFGAEKRSEAQLDRQLDEYERLTDEQARLTGLSLASVNVLSDVTPFLVVLAGSLLVIDGRLTLGTLIAFFAYVDRMRAPVAALVQAFPAIAEGSVALHRVFDFLAAPVTVREAERPVEFAGLKRSVEFRGVGFAYNGKDDVIRNLSLTLEKGRTYAFVGESGGGKSTVLQLLTRMYDADRGAVLIDGADIKDIALASLRGRMGIVTQDQFLYSCSIGENIRMAKPGASDAEVEAAARKAFAHEFIAALPDGYGTEAGERGVKLSGGQRQRIALARVFLKDPDILLLDEATSALDNESEELVQRSIREIGPDKTVVMVAHRLSTVLHADTIFVMRKGEIVESGDHRSLLEAGGFYKELYARQSAGEAEAPAPEAARGRAPGPAALRREAAKALA